MSLLDNKQENLKKKLKIEIKLNFFDKKYTFKRNK